jgi:hypothetical protein
MASSFGGFEDRFQGGGEGERSSAVGLHAADAIVA